MSCKNDHTASLTVVDRRMKSATMKLVVFNFLKIKFSTNLKKNTDSSNQNNG